MSVGFVNNFLLNLSIHKGPSNLNRPQEFPRKGHLRLQREILLRVRPASLWWDDASGVPWQPTKVKLPNLWTSSSCGGRGGWPSYGEGQFWLLWRHNQWPQNRNLWKLVLGSGSWEQKRVLHRHLCQQRYRWSSCQSFCHRAWQTCVSSGSQQRLLVPALKIPFFDALGVTVETKVIMRSHLRNKAYQ